MATDKHMVEHQETGEERAAFALAEAKARLVIRLATRSLLWVVLFGLVLYYTIVGVLWVFYALTGILLVIVLAIFFAYLIAPLVEFVTGIDWIGWNRTVLDYLKNHIDYLAIHLYVGNRENDYYEFVSNSVDLDQRIETTEGVINAALSGLPRGRRIDIAWDEWNVWYRARGAQQRGRRILEERYNLEDALVVATFLNSFVNHARSIKMANMAQLVNVIAPIFTSETGMFLQTIYYPLQLFASHTRGQALGLFVESPKYESKRFGEVPYLDLSAGYDQGTLVVNATPRSG